MAIHKVTITITAIHDERATTRAYAYSMARAAETLARHARTTGGVFVQHEECETMAEAIESVLACAAESAHVEVVGLDLEKRTPADKEAN